MKSSPYISIPKPCHEDWNAMTAVDKGRFCSSCQKKVHDFTQAPDTAILEIIRKSQDVCGRFHISQLDRKLVEPSQKSSVWTAAASGVLGLLSMASAEAQHSEKQGTIVVLGEYVKSDNPEKFIQGDTIVTTKNKWIEGTVSDNAGPLPGATISTTSRPDVMTDIDGKFRIKATVGDTLKVEFPGFHTLAIQVTEDVNYKIIMPFPNNISDEIVVTGRLVRPNFFKRLYYRVKNWFR
ncbi:carboxypeptidase-like regulatory domain-containing protein [Flavobacterium sp.]|uniref:carboxypeptidase-like regulatory domain-containing protein n=1 Tax=Flavobacterium sp. TaxID=239 RepID=UPI0025BAF6B8|nr:carboxypeptidase-like regulatory domain-containing protein [Flavobacterium sp.]